MKFSTAAITAAGVFTIWMDVVAGVCPARTSPFVIDFEEKKDGSALSRGDTIDGNVILPCDVVCKAQRWGSDPWNKGMIYNSDCGACVSSSTPGYDATCSGQDPDLGVGLGNMLIVSEDLDSSDPDDYHSGGDIRCYFLTPTYVNSITYVDIDVPNPGQTKFFSSPHNDMTSSLGMVPLPFTGEIQYQGTNPSCTGGIEEQAMDMDGVTWFQAWSGTSFAIASIEICKPDGSTFGDPHFVTFSGDPYDYHGICDLKFVESPSNNLLVHLRTEKKYHYSYISAAAIKLNEDIFEFGSHGQVMVNGVLISGDMELPETFGGHALTLIASTKDTHTYRVDFGDDTGLEVKSYKEMVAVSLRGPHTKFADSVGLMGDPATGRKLGRDGKTVFDDNSINDFGQEWQVLADEPMLFDVAREPQAPQRCMLPTTWIRGHSLEMRQLSETVPRSEAEEACAKWTVNKEACIEDVIVTGDKDLAAAFF